MSSMIERVARAICALSVSYLGITDTQTLEERIDDEWPDYEQDARVAIEAMMWPTAQMVVAGINAIEDKDMDGPSVWQAMLTAALADAPGEG